METIVFALCTLKKNVNSLCRNKVFKQTAESVNDVVSFLCPDKQNYLTHTMYVSFVCLKSILFRVVQVLMFDVTFCAPSPFVLFFSLMMLKWIFATWLQ